MDRRLNQAARTGDLQTLAALFKENNQIIEQRNSLTHDTALHIASKLGHVEFVAELIKMKPELVMAENVKMETAFHEACREGHLEVSKVLLQSNSKVVDVLNIENQSALFMACGRGHLQIAKSLLGFPWLLGAEDDGSSTSLHQAAMGGHIDIVKEICKLRPDFVWRRDAEGCYPIHLSSSKGHLEVTREFLKIDSDLAIMKDNEGRTPLHFAVTKGFVSIIHEVISTSPQSTLVLTNQGESVLHLAVKNNRYDALRYLTESTACPEFMNLPDNEGNTVLHNAVTAKLLTTVRYLATKAEHYLDVNAMNKKGYTALDIIITNDSNSSGALQVVAQLQEIGAKCCGELLQEPSPRKQRTNNRSQLPRRTKKMNNIADTPTREYPAREEHGTRHRHRRERRLKSHYEGLRNARNTIIIVAVLIATVAFSAGVTPPGGLYQDGKFAGKSIAANSTAFKVFTVSNTVALFMSLALVTVLVSIIPFRRRSIKLLLIVTHKVMWAAVMFMAVAYVAATWVVLPRGKSTAWLLATVLAVAGGVTGLVFVALIVMLVKHWIRKLELKNEKEQNDISPRSASSTVSKVEELRTMKIKASPYSSDSDVESSEKSGYHTY